MCRDRAQIAHERVVEYDIACLLAGRVAELEGLEPRTVEWADRLSEVYHEARVHIEGTEAA